MLGAVEGVRNRIVTALGGYIGSQQRLTPRIDQLALPLPPDEMSGFKMYGQYRGSTPNVESLSCHASALTSGHCPHPPHTHPEEEILVMLAGEADLILPQMPSSDGTCRLRLRPGQFVFYPAHFPHTLQAVDHEPANYLMFKWRGLSASRKGRLAFGRFDAADFVATHNNPKPLEYAVVLEAPTTWLGRLEVHVTTLAPGAGFTPHRDLYDAAIVVLQGEIEALGRRVRRHGLILFVGGELHSIHNPGTRPAEYVVFELERREPFFRKVSDPQRWKRKLAAPFGLKERT